MTASSFPKPALTADAVVLAGTADDMCLLVVERAHEPDKGRYALPGGFVDEGEPPLRAALRELSEETGLDLPIYAAEPLSIRGRMGRDPRGWTVTQPFLFHVPEPRPVRAGDDAARAIWVRLVDLETLAFDHGAIVCEALGCFWPRMPTFRNRFVGIEPFGGTGPSGEDVVFYGGSFNPWHEGHGACIRLFSETGQLVVVPDFSPFKQGAKRHCHWRFLRELAGRIQGCALFPGFCGRETANPTVGWLPRVTYARIGFLIGEDNLVSMRHWHGSEVLVRALHALYVAPRRETDGDLAAARAWALKTHPELKLQTLGDHAYRDLSSTGLRTKSTPTD